MRVLLLFLGLASFFPSAISQSREIIDKVVATVGGEIVLLSEIEEQKALMAAQQGGLPGNADCFILDNVLAQELLVNQAKLDSILLTEEEVEAQLDARIDQILAYMNNDFQQFEDYYGQSVNEVKDQFRTDLRSQMLAERMRAQIIQDVTVTPAEVKDFFSKIPRDSLPYFSAEVEMAEVVYRPPVNEAQRQVAISKLEEIRKRILEQGEDFAVLAQKYSDDFASARIGGDLGWTRRGKFVAEFEAAAYNLEVDQISEIVESEFGFHIIQLLGRRGNTIHTRHILVRAEITPEDLDKAKVFLDSIRGLILNDSLAFGLAVKRYGDKNYPSYNNDGRMTNPTTGNTFFEIGDLDPDIYFAIDTLKTGGITQAFPFRGPDGEMRFRIIKLQSKTPPHRANLEQDYSRIQAAAIDQKKNQFINDWIAEKVENTYIEIDPRYQTCPNLSKWVGGD